MLIESKWGSLMNMNSCICDIRARNMARYGQGKFHSRFDQHVPESIYKTSRVARERGMSVLAFSDIALNGLSITGDPP